MNVQPIEKIDCQKKESLISTYQDLAPPAHVKNVSASTLPEVFSRDELDHAEPTQQCIQPVILTDKVSSSWSNWLAWVSLQIKSFSTVAISETDLQTSSKVETVSFKPLLDPPESTSIEFATASLPPSHKRKQDTLSQNELAEGLSLMSDQTFEKILFIMNRAHIEFGKENARVTKGLYHQYQEFKKIEQQTLLEIQEVLKQDKKVANFFKTSQNIAVAASFVCGIAAAAVSFSLLAPVGAFVGAVAGNMIGGLFVTVASFLGSVGSIVTSVLTGMTGGFKAYSQRQLNVSKAEHENLQYQDKYYKDRVKDMYEWLISIADTDHVNKERLFQILKEVRRTCKFILAK